MKKFAEFLAVAANLRIKLTIIAIGIIAIFSYLPAVSDDVWMFYMFAVVTIAWINAEQRIIEIEGKR